MSQVIRVMPEHVTALWPKLEPLVVRAMRGIPTHEPDDIRRILMGGQAHLWLQWSDKPEAFVITEFVNYPRGVWLRMWLGAADESARLDDKAFFAVIDQFRKQSGCNGYELIGRLGWMRRLGPLFPGARVDFEGFLERVTLDGDNSNGRRRQ